ncbi:MAG: lysoplasmalogenase [Planctomycetales bacterium]|nr:lysoplasmalogenase [Planctomycetales bacterium]
MLNSRNPKYSLLAAVWGTVWLLLLAAGLTAHLARGTVLSSMETALKAGSSLALVLFGWINLAILPQERRRIAMFVALGMTLGCLGDASPLLGSRWPDPQRTLGNMVLFGLGHLAYIRACVVACRTVKNGTRQWQWYGSIALWLLLGCLTWYFAAYRGPRFPVLKLPALGYTLLLATTTGVATACARSCRSFIAVAVGAMLFLASDLLLAVWIFHDRVYRPFDLVWLTYGIGQMLIVFGVFNHVRNVDVDPTNP